MGSNNSDDQIHKLKKFMGIVCEDCEGEGWYSGAAYDYVRCDWYEEQIQCERCNGTGELT